MSSYDDMPDGYVPCNCHPETCCHKDGLVFVGTNKKPKIIKDKPYIVYFKDTKGIERIGIAEKYSSNMLLVRENSFTKSLIRKKDCVPIKI